MTKEDMILLAEFIAGYDVAGTPMSGGLGVGDLIPEEAWEVWIEGLIVQHDGKEVCILPDKSKGDLKIRTFIMKNGDLFDYDWVPTDEELVAELKKKGWRAGDCASWLEQGEIKYILLQKFPEALNL